MIRKGLIRWRILGVGTTAVLCLILYQLVDTFRLLALTDRPMDGITAGVLFTFLGGIVTALGFVIKKTSKDEPDDTRGTND